ncbi:hypothetical protein FHG66_04855 [Rubellimicrobium rubrum]|uniref:HupE/UreJ family protein n=1 Tax=Rubellimicrobium rubrum TaxID=2585369 RepID=A0A5C4MZ33_9RHOB|nr:hypothetical protein [Rubellimicrobium rubrum]TNC51500.1 hypothetical protein FHG66_04855 [Rubellimicrobium rubrum]
MRRAAWLPLALAAAPAWAHDLPQTFGKGLAVLPGPLLLPLLSLGLMLAVSGRLRLLAGAVPAIPLGFVAAPWIGINADILALGAGLACAILATTGLPLAGTGHGALALGTALLAGAALTHGAGWLAMELSALLGLALAGTGAMALPPVLGLALLARWPVPARIGLRIGASWLAAIGALALSLTFAGPLP